MANPVITSITQTPAGDIAPGQTVDFLVAATDADTRSGTLRFQVLDGLGNASPFQDVPFTVVDPLDSTGLIVSGGGTLVKDVTNPLLWHYTA